MNKVQINEYSGMPNMYDPLTPQLLEYIDDSNTNHGPLFLLVIIVILYYSIFSSFNSVGTPQFYSPAPTTVMMQPTPVVSATTIPSFFTPTPTFTGGSMMGSMGTRQNSLAEILVWTLLIFLLVASGMKYIFNVNVTAVIKDLFSGTPKLNLDIHKMVPEDGGENANVQPSDLVPQKQVYNIPEQEYTYNDAKAVCKALDGRLADYNEVQKAQKNGGEWCELGWSQHQMTLAPTQEQTWKELQNIPGQENSCGRPGVNGGFVGNPQERHGVNCYGIKPRPTPEEASKMANEGPVPVTEADEELNRKVNEYKDKLPQIMISPFNANAWSMF